MWKGGYQKMEYYIYNERCNPLTFEENKENWSSSNDLTMKWFEFTQDLNHIGSSLNVVQDEVSWWIDMEALRHVYMQENVLVQDLKNVVDGEALYM